MFLVGFDNFLNYFMNMLIFVTLGDIVNIIFNIINMIPLI